MKKRISFLCLLLVLLLSACSLAEAWDPEVAALTLLPQEAAAQAGEIPLYAGPTAQFPQVGMIDLSEPFVFLGQADCWAFVAAGTPEAAGIFGWIQASAAAFPEEPELLFEDAVPVDLMEDTFLTAEPFAEEPSRLAELPAGTRVTLLATLGEWGYAQVEIDAVPYRGFLPLDSFL